MPSANEPRQPTPPILVWWIIWGAILSAFFSLYAIFTTSVKLPPAAPSGLWMLAAVPLLGSLILRFFVFPRFAGTPRAFAAFIVGLALAEAGGLTGIFLGGELRTAFAAAAIVLLILHVPAFLHTRVS